MAVGTSLSELVATLAAALKGRSDVAFGNIVGSNLYNILGILGVTALIQPLEIPADIGTVDWAVMIGGACLMIAFAASSRRLARLEGAVLLVIYCGYVSYLFSR